MKVILKFFKLLALFNLVNGRIDYKVDDVLELIKNAGYKGFSYRVVTDDGYILKLHRIKPAAGISTKPPVYLQHGLFATAADFLVTGPKIALAYYLADNNYDVWMGNTRGNKHSEKHKTLSTHSREFWSFSFHEMGYYDVKAMFDFMMNATKASRAFCVGHSQGASALTVFLSTRPEYNKKVIQTHLLSPAVIMKHLPHPLISTLAEEIRIGLFLDYRYVNLTSVFDFGNDFTNIFCVQKQRATLAICSSIIFGIVGPNRHGVEIDTRILKTIVQHVSPRISVQQLVHYIQLYYSGKFQTFDYRWKHFNRQKSTTPALYDLNCITSPVYIYSATEDWLVAPQDAQQFKKLLPNVPRSRVIPNWNHLDFTYGKNARKVLYKNILQDFERALN